MPGMIELRTMRAGMPQVWRFYQGTGDSDTPGSGARAQRFARAEVHALLRADSEEYAPQASEVIDLAPWTEIPIVAFASGRMDQRHCCLPPFLAGAKLDHLLLNVTSNVEFATIIANTFMRFAKGLSKGDIEKWKDVGPLIFYATTSPEADMKWITLPAEGLQAGMSLADSLVRALEVEMLAPMLQRSAGDERATGQAIASARAMSAAEMIAAGWETSATRTWRFVAESLSLLSAESPVTVELDKDAFGFFGSNGERAELLARMYVSEPKRITPEVFWREMQRLEVLKQDVDVDSLTRALLSEDQQRRRDEQGIERARLMLDAHGAELFRGREGRVVVYQALKDAGIGLPATFNPETQADADFAEPEGERPVPAGDVRRAGGAFEDEEGDEEPET